jgi:transcriptional regulator with XRE-family HTH domain
MYLEPYCIGMKLRALRIQKNLTLSRLAAQTALSTALLSKLETDRMIPTLSTLATICRFYGVGLSHFFTETERHTVSITRRADLHARRSAEWVKSVPLHVPEISSGLIAEMVEVPANGEDALHSAKKRKTCGLVYVIEGRLQLDTGGMHEVLDVGDCVFIESGMPMVWKAADKHPCCVLAVRSAEPPRLDIAEVIKKTEENIDLDSSV